MVRGWYTGASGMLAQQHRLDVISNNLANVDTTSYKRDVTVSKFPELLLRRLQDDGVYKNPSAPPTRPHNRQNRTRRRTERTVHDFSQGSYKQTSSSSDMALEGRDSLPWKPLTANAIRATAISHSAGRLSHDEGRLSLLGEKAGSSCRILCIQSTKTVKYGPGRSETPRPTLNSSTGSSSSALKRPVPEKQGSSLYIDTPVSGPPAG